MTTKRAITVVLTIVAVSIGCGKKSGGGGSTSPSPTLTSVSISPGTDMVRIKANETFTLTAAFSDGTSQTVQGTWTSDATAVATVDGSSGRVTGVSSGQATVAADYQGRRATRLIRVVPDYHGRWAGDWSVTACSATLDWEGACDEFPVGDLYGFSLVANQTRDSISGTTDFGDDLPGSVTGTIATNGRLAINSTYTVSFEGIPVEISVSNWDTNTTDNQTLTGTFRVTFRVVGLLGSLQVDGRVRVVTKVSSTPASFGIRPAARGPISVIRALRQ